MAFDEQAPFTEQPNGLPDIPSDTLTPTQIKSYFQTPLDELKTTLNNALTKLNSTASGNSGADNTGATGFDGTASNIQTLLNYLKANKTDLTGDHKGTWQGFTPSQVDQTIRDQVNTNTAQLADMAINVKMPPVPMVGAKGDGVTDDTTAIRNICASYNNIFFPYANYLIQLANANRESLAWFTDRDNITILGAGANLIDNTNYVVSTLTNIFGFTRCNHIKIKGLYYKGKPIADPDNQLNNLGVCFAYFEDHCSDIEVDTYLENARYGVRSGDYLNPAYGYCKDFKIKVLGKMVGYPIALYLADNVEKAFLDVQGTHRICYLAGVYGANIESYCQDQYGATVQNLMTNTITTYDTVQANQRARGCKNIKIKTIDKGSTHYQQWSMMAGIGLQWVCQGTEFANIDVEYYVRSDDTKASQIGGFQIASTAKDPNSIDRNYPFNWEPYITLKNIKVSGTIDRTGQTVATNQAGELYIECFDSADNTYSHCPSVSNVDLNDIVMVKGSVQSRALYIEIPNLQDVLRINNLQAQNVDTIMQARTGKVVISNSNIRALSVGSIIADLKLDNTYANSIDYTKITKLSYGGFALALANTGVTMRQLVASTVAGQNTYTFPSAIKKANFTKAVVAVMAGFTDAGTWDMGITGNTTYFGTGNLNGSNGYNRFGTTNYAANALPKYFTADSDLIITLHPVGTLPAGLSLNIFIFEETYTV